METRGRDPGWWTTRRLSALQDPERGSTARHVTENSQSQILARNVDLRNGGFLASTTARPRGCPTRRTPKANPTSRFHDPSKEGWCAPAMKILRLFRRRRSAVAWALPALLLVLPAVHGIASAQALTNRRICTYLADVPTTAKVESQTKPGSYHTIPADLYVGINYKKDGDCPLLSDPYPIAGDNTRRVRLTYRQPVPKDVCEDWGRLIGVTDAYLGTMSPNDPRLHLAKGPNPFLVDVCSQMAVDTVYEFYVIRADHYFVDGSDYRQGQFVTNKEWNVRV